MRERSVKLSEEHYQLLLTMRRDEKSHRTLRRPLCEILELAVDDLFERCTRGNVGI